MAAALCAAVAWSCSPSAPERVEQVAPPVPARVPGPRLVLQAKDAEVWAWDVLVQGVLEGPGDLAACSVFADERAYPAVLEGRAFSAAVELDEGHNAVQARCRRAQRGELRSEVVRFRVPLRDAPVARARVTLQDGDLVLDAAESSPSEHSRADIAEYVWFAAGALGAEPRARLGAGERLEIAAPEASGAHSYELRVTDAHGESDTARVQVIVRDGRVLDPGAEHTPAFVRETVVYGVFPLLFGSPPLRSVTAALDQLAELGVTALWLAPIFESPADDYGYAVTDYFAVRDEYGSEADLARLVARAHALGLRVLLDLVPNHTSAEHPYFEQALALGPRSHYFDFYDRDPLGRPTHYFDWEHLPNLEYDNPEVERFMRHVSAYWVRRFEVDGYRVDAAWGVARRDPGFYPTFIAEVRRARPDALLLAEASARDPYYVRTGFDAAYDWTEELGQWAWQGVFSERPGIARRLHTAIMKSAALSPPERTLRFLNNNDTGARFITRHGEGMTRVATAALLTLPGVPALFTFDEVGAEFEPYAVQGPIAPPERPALRRWHERLIALRKSTPALHGPGFLPLHVGETDEVYAFLRMPAKAPVPPGAHEGAASPEREVALVALNFSDRPAAVEIALPEALGRGQALRLRGALSGERLRARRGVLRLSLPPFGVRVLQPR